MSRAQGPVLAAGAALAGAAMLLTHPLAVAGALALALAYAWGTGAFQRSSWLAPGALGIGLAVLAFNVLFAWKGATALWEAPFRLALLGRPRLTVEALSWGAVAGAQLATTVLALGAATLTVPPERLHRALVDVGAPASLATAAGLALRMVPDTRKDAQAMRQALATRGVRAKGLRGTSQVLVPLTARALDRSIVAEEALRMRGYDPEASTTGRGLGPWAGVGLAGVLLAGLVAFLGPGRPSYYPTVELAFDPVTLVALATALALPVLLTLEVLRCSR